NLEQVPEPTEAVNGSGDFGQLIVEQAFEPIWNKSTGAATNQIEMLIWYVEEMWVAKPEGITILKPDPLETVGSITREHGLLANNVTSMDRSPLTGNLWVGTNAGLAEIDMDEYSVVRVVTKADGLVDNEGWYFGSVRLDEKGNVHFGTAKGLSIFRPELDVEDGHMPLLQLERSDFSQKGGGDNEINFEYAALSFAQERKVQYRTRLVGFDEDWSPPTTEYKIRYTNLPALFIPKEYTFEVMATSNGTDWTNEPLSYSFLVKPPWILRWWAFVIEAALLAGILFVYLRYKNTQHKKELKRERDISNKLQQVDKLKDQFLANTSHELRTPLNGIIGLAESLIDREQDKNIRKDLSMIFASGKRLANLVNDILDFSKMKNQDLVLQSQPVGLHTIVEVVLRLSEPLIIQKELELVNQVDENLPLVMGDENRLEQVLHNLVGNAIKFTETGSVTIAAEVQGDRVAVSVSDTGIGIPEDKFDTIFQSFEQADGSTAREYGGTGLGLSVSKQLIELHGGTITVQSQIGEGSTFTFTLPLSSADAIAEAEKNPRKREELIRKVELDAPVERSLAPETEKEEGVPATNGVGEAVTHASLISSHPVNILVVDDEPVNRQVLENHLSLAGYSVTQASNGPEALKIMQNGHDFDLILLDIMMPRMSGYEVCHRLREIYLPSELPVVMLTAKNRVSDLVEGFDLGANDYLIKPFSKEELLTRIKTHLNLHRVHQATGRFVPNEFLRSVGRDSITDVELGDHMEKEVTVFFSDIRSYTTLSENMTPQENFKFVNAYVGRMGPLIKQHNGFVNQYLGDGIMAIFPRNASDALQSSIEQQREVHVYNERRTSKGKIPITIGIGMHTGPLVMGIIGDTDRNDTATISDTVNAASRMEGLTKYYGANIIISGEGLGTIDNKDQFNIRYLSKVQVKGKNEVIEAYECFDGDPPEMIEKKLNTKSLYEEGLKQYFEKDFAAATGTFGLILRENQDDKVARYFLSKSAGFIQTGVPDDWTGVVKWDNK
ncbi:MAG: ATP-binding protein, partial [Saprospiraceae bacterium]|nr:ATP-binding protein [Saprospiraceae bacterium]